MSSFADITIVVVVVGEFVQGPPRELARAAAKTFHNNDVKPVDENALERTMIDERVRAAVDR